MREEQETLAKVYQEEQEAAKAARRQRRAESEAVRVDVLLRTADVLALLLFAGGMLFVVFFFPVLAHRTYFSENALLVNAAAPSALTRKHDERAEPCFSHGRGGASRSTT